MIKYHFVFMFFNARLDRSAFHLFFIFILLVTGHFDFSLLGTWSYSAMLDAGLLLTTDNYNSYYHQLLFFVRQSPETINF